MSLKANPKINILPAFLLIALLFAPSAFAEQWIHVKVHGSDDEKVTLNLPMSLMRSVVSMLPDEVQNDIDEEVRVGIDELDMEWGELREFWDAVKDAPEATFATVQTRDETLAVKKEGRFLMVQTLESTPQGTKIDVQIPLQVVDALFSGPDGTLNFGAALDALADYGDGHLVSIRDGEDTVQIWIDDQNLAD